MGSNIMNTNLNTIRRNKKISLKDLSKRTGIRFATIQSLNNGSKFINHCDESILSKIADALEVNKEQLLEGKNLKYKDIDNDILSYCYWQLVFILELSCEGTPTGEMFYDVEGIWKLFLIMCGDELSLIQERAFDEEFLYKGIRFVFYVFFWTHEEGNENMTLDDFAADMQFMGGLTYFNFYDFTKELLFLKTGGEISKIDFDSYRNAAASFSWND